MNYTFSVGDKLRDPSFPKWLFTIVEIKPGHGFPEIFIQPKREEPETKQVFPPIIYTEAAFLERLREGTFSFIYKQSEETYVPDEFDLLKNLW